MSSMDESSAILTIDLEAIAQNYRYLADRVAPAECCAVVKADAYGLGLAAVAPVLRDAGCETFFVATLEEGIALRTHLADADIHVFNGAIAGTEAKMAEHGLTPALNSLDAIQHWQSFQHTRDEVLPADIHIDTGMSRLGLMPEDVSALVSDKAAMGKLDIDCVFSHLACADDPASPMNRQQLNEFEACRSLIQARRAGIAAASGTFLGDEFHFDFIRPGIALYGGNPTPGNPNPMRQTIRFQARILQVRTLDAPRTVGYGATHAVNQPTKVATIAVGYADGYLRAASGRAITYIGDQAAPVLGRISMDLTTIDVTNIPEDLIQPGGLVDVIGPHNPLDDFAAAADTIGYEILTRLGPRLHRHYLPAESR